MHHRPDVTGPACADTAVADPKDTPREAPKHTPTARAAAPPYRKALRIASIPCAAPRLPRVR